MKRTKRDEKKMKDGEMKLMVDRKNRTRNLVRSVGKSFGRLRRVLGSVLA
jgi:hypothetical protein